MGSVVRTINNVRRSIHLFKLCNEIIIVQEYYNIFFFNFRLKNKTINNARRSINP